MCSDNKLMVFIKNTNYILVTDAMCEGTKWALAHTTLFSTGTRVGILPSRMKMVTAGFN